MRAARLRLDSLTLVLALGVAISAFSLALDDPALEVFDKTTGALLTRIALPANAQGALMTYMVRGRQYIVIPVGGANLPAELIALSLP